MAKQYVYFVTSKKDEFFLIKKKAISMIIMECSISSLTVSAFNFVDLNNDDNNAN